MYVSQCSFKDVGSVSLYPYNRSQILQYAKYTKQINSAKEMEKNSYKYCVLGQKVKTQQQQNYTKNQT